MRGLNGGINTYGYVKNSPLHFVDPLGLDLFTLHGGASIPFFGGYEVGAVYDNGIGGYGRPDFGIFFTFKKNYAGVGLAKATIGMSQTLGGRFEFDGVDATLNVGLAGVG